MENRIFGKTKCLKHAGDPNAQRYDNYLPHMRGRPQQHDCYAFRNRLNSEGCHPAWFCLFVDESFACRIVAVAGEQDAVQVLVY